MTCFYFFLAKSVLTIDASLALGVFAPSEEAEVGCSVVFELHVVANGLAVVLLRVLFLLLLFDDDLFGDNRFVKGALLLVGLASLAVVFAVASVAGIGLVVGVELHVFAQLLGKDNNGNFDFHLVLIVVAVLHGFRHCVVKGRWLFLLTEFHVLLLLMRHLLLLLLGRLEEFAIDRHSLHGCAGSVVDVGHDVGHDGSRALGAVALQSAVAVDIFCAVGTALPVVFVGVALLALLSLQWHLAVPDLEVLELLLCVEGISILLHECCKCRIGINQPFGFVGQDIAVGMGAAGEVSRTSDLSARSIVALALAEGANAKVLVVAFDVAGSEESSECQLAFRCVDNLFEQACSFSQLPIGYAV